MANIGWGTGSGAAIALDWATNCALQDAQIVDGAVVLEFNRFTADADTCALYHLEEPITGETGEILDSSGNSNHLTPVGAVLPSLVTGWMDSGVQFGASSDQGLQITPMPESMKPSEFAVELWIKLLSPSAGTTFIMGGGDGYEIWYIARHTDGLGRAMIPSPNGNAMRLLNIDFSPLDDGEWHALCLQFDDTTKVSNLYLDGIIIASNTWVGRTLAYGWRPFRIGNTGSNGTLTEAPNAIIDEVRVSSVVRYGESYEPSRYKVTGVVTTANNSIEGTLNSVSWAVGEEGGNIHQVYVFSDGEYVQVGGDNPSSPISGLSLPVSSGNLLKFVLTPSGANKAITSRLLWAKADISPFDVEPPIIRPAAITSDLRSAVVSRAEVEIVSINLQPTVLSSQQD